MSFFGKIKLLAKLATMMLMLLFCASGQNVQAEETAKAKVIEFYASWCEPCRRLQPVMDSAKAKYGEDVEFISYNVDDPASREAIEQYGVCPIPTVIFVDSKEQISGYAIGCTEERSIRKGINKILPQTVISSAQHSNVLN